MTKEITDQLDEEIVSGRLRLGTQEKIELELKAGKITRDYFTNYVLLNQEDAPSQNQIAMYSLVYQRVLEILKTQPNPNH